MIPLTVAKKKRHQSLDMVCVLCGVNIRRDFVELRLQALCEHGIHGWQALDGCEHR